MRLYSRDSKKLDFANLYDLSKDLKKKQKKKNTKSRVSLFGDTAVSQHNPKKMTQVRCFHFVLRHLLFKFYWEKKKIKFCYKTNCLTLFQPFIQEA